MIDLLHDASDIARRTRTFIRRVFASLWRVSRPNAHLIESRDGGSQDAHGGGVSEWRQT